MLLTSFSVIRFPTCREPTMRLVQSFGRVRFHERRATGRRGALPGLVVHGAVRLQVALATRMQTFTASDLVPHDRAPLGARFVLILPFGKRLVASSSAFAKIQMLIFLPLNHNFSRPVYGPRKKQMVCRERKLRGNPTTSKLLSI